MSNNNYEIVPLFPIPLFIATLPNSLSYISSWLNEQPMRVNNATIGNEYGEISKDTYILNNNKYKELKDTILKYALEYGSNTLGYASPEYKITQSWISCKYPNQKHQTHVHPNSVISGVLYYNFVPQSKCLDIEFHNPNQTPSPKVFSPTIKVESNDILNVFTARTYNIFPNPGTLLLFPSSLAHSVPKNTTKEIRKSLAFNIVPKEGFGDIEELTELKLN